MAVIGVNALSRFYPIGAIPSQLPPVQNTEQPVALMSERPKLSATLRIHTDWTWGNTGWLIDRVLISQTILSHDLACVTHSLIACKQIMNVHSARINVFEI